MDDDDDDEVDTDEISSPEPSSEIIIDEQKFSSCHHLFSRLEPFKNLSITTKESKKQAWLQFISLWSEILQLPATDAQPCYVECARLLPLLMKLIGFHSLRKEVYVARESFFPCITQLNQHHMKNYLLLDKEQQKLVENQIYYKHIYYSLLIASKTASLIPFETINDQKFINNHAELFTLFIERIEKSILQHSPTIIEKDYAIGIINERILYFLWNLTDRTVLIPTLIKCGLAKRVVSWISQAAMLRKKSRRPLISIVHNIARHDDGADELNKYDAINIIKQYQNLQLEKKDSRTLIISMTLALLSTPEQLKHDSKGMNILLNRLLQLVKTAAKCVRYRYDGVHVSEPLGVLVKMFVVEERTLDYVLCHAETKPSSDTISTIQLFVSLFFKFSDALKSADRLKQFTLIALLNILWSISFQPNYAQELIKNQEFIEKLKTYNENNNQQDIIEQYKPRSMEGIRQAIDGILHNLNIDDNTKDETKSVQRINNKSWIMISYCHDNNIFCSEIFDMLSTHNDVFDIWIDRTHCQGVIDLWESIADGMEQASIIVCLLSNQYFESKSCRQEFVYASDSLKKRIVPVLIGNFEPKGWLGIRMTGMKYIRFRDLGQLDKNKMTELLNTILSSVSSPKTENRLLSQHCIEPSPEVNVTSVPIDPFDQQTSTSNDIHTWFAEHRISEQLRDIFDFQSNEEMLDYAELLIKDRDQQMNIYARIFAQKYGKDMPPHEFYRFASALERLLKEKRPSSISVKLNSPIPIKSSACIIF